MPRRQSRATRWDGLLTVVAVVAWTASTAAWTGGFLGGAVPTGVVAASSPSGADGGEPKLRAGVVAELATGTPAPAPPAVR